VLLLGDRAEIAKARDRARKTWPSIVGFTVGCGFGAICEARLELHSLVLPAVLSLLALAIGIASKSEQERQNGSIAKEPTA